MRNIRISPHWARRPEIAPAPMQAAMNCCAFKGGRFSLSMIRKPRVWPFTVCAEATRKPYIRKGMRRGSRHRLGPLPPRS